MRSRSCASEILNRNSFSRKVLPLVISVAAASLIATQPASAPQNNTARVAAPVAGKKMTDTYLQMAARNVYFWA